MGNLTETQDGEHRSGNTLQMKGEEEDRRKKKRMRKKKYKRKRK